MLICDSICTSKTGLKIHIDAVHATKAKFKIHSGSVHDGNNQINVQFVTKVTKHTAPKKLFIYSIFQAL